jgi:VanZ family protein
MGLIFWASADAASGHRGARLLGPLLRWCLPEASPQRIDEIIFVLRKVAHVSEYAVLAWLAQRLFLALDMAATASRRMIRSALLAWPFCVVYAISDEWHQTFVPTRVGTPWDVLIDSAGAALGLAVAAVWFRLRPTVRAGDPCVRSADRGPDPEVNPKA